MLRISLEKPLQYDLPESCRIKELVFPRDSYAYQFLLWQGFNHGNDVKEFEKTKQDTVMQQPHRRPELALAVTDGAGNFIAHCGCWYADATDYAYVEPVCVVPEARKQGIGRAVVSEALNRCRKLGAKEAYVLSEQEFYQRLGFEKYTKHVFYWKKER